MSRDLGTADSKVPLVTIAGRVTVLTALYASLVVMLRTAEGGALSLFLSHLGAEHLPYTFLAISLFDIPLALIFMRLSRRLSSQAFLAGLALTLIAVLAISRGMIDVQRSTGLFMAYTAATILNTFVVIQWGAVILEFFTVKESMRAFPIIYIGAHVGSFLAGVLLRHLARPVGTENLLIVVPAAAGVAAIALIVVARRLAEGKGWRQGERPEAKKIPSQGAAAGVEVMGGGRLSLLRTSPMLQLIAASTAVMVFLRLALRTSYGAGLEAAFPAADDLTRFIGSYTIVAAVVGIAMQILATPALLRWLGVGLLNALYSYFVAAALAVSTFAPGLGAAVMGRFTDLDLKSAIKTPVSPMFYEAMGVDHRRDARAIIIGIISPLASLLSSLALVAITASQLPVLWIAAAGMALSALFILLAHLQGRTYYRALEQLLIEWYGARVDDSEVTIDRAIEGAEGSDDRRMSDMAREVRRRRRVLS